MYRRKRRGLPFRTSSPSAERFRATPVTPDDGGAVAAEPIPVPRAKVEEEVRSFMLRVYWWMTAGLAVTGIVSMSIPKETVFSFFKSTWAVLGGWIGLMIFVFMFSAFIHRLSAPVASLVFLGYSAAMGFMLSPIHYVYAQQTIHQAFFVTAGMFAATSLYGLITKRDLTGLGHFAMMGLFGLIIAIIVNMFFKSPMMGWIISVVGVIIFTALTAYDTQQIKEMAESGELSQQASILGALTLYLDFINLFLYLLQLFAASED